MSSTAPAAPASSTAMGKVERLAADLRSGTVTSTEVTIDYFNRALHAHRLSHCLAARDNDDLETFRALALQEAAARDNDPIAKPGNNTTTNYSNNNNNNSNNNNYNSNYNTRSNIKNGKNNNNGNNDNNDGNILPALHGVPFSVKECYCLRGTDSCIGFPTLQGNRSTIRTDAGLIESLRHIGAVPLAKTNVPQSMLSFECDNPVYGRTRNPHCPALSPGGSSGGEAALIAAGGAPFGLGTDIGGSARIPAHFCGIAALKFSPDRVSGAGKIPPGLTYAEGSTAVRSSPGLMATTIRDVAFVAGHLLSAENLEDTRRRIDSYVVPVPFRRELYESRRPLRIGWYTHDGFLEASPPCRRAVEESRAVLERLGHTLVPFDPPRVSALVMEIYFPIVSSSAELIREVLATGEIHDSLRMFVRMLSVPRWARGWVASLLSRIDPIAGLLFRGFGGKETAEFYKHVADLTRYRAEFDGAVRAAGIDVLLSPAHVLPAIPHGTSSDITPTCSYTMLYNAVDYCAGVIPATRLDPETDLWPFPTPSPSVMDKKIRSVYDRILEQKTNIPIGVQVAAPPYCEEVCLSVLQQLEDNLKYR